MLIYVISPSNAFCQHPSQEMARYNQSSLCLKLFFLFVCLFSALELCSFPVRERKLDWKLFLSAAHYQLPPDAPTAPLSPHALLPLQMGTLSIPPSPVRLSGKCLCPCACPQEWMLFGWVYSAYSLFTLQLNWEVMPGLDIKDIQFDDFASSVPTGGSVWCSLLWRR